MSGLFRGMFDFDHDGEMVFLKRLQSLTFCKTFWTMKEVKEWRTVEISLATTMMTMMTMKTTISNLSSLKRPLRRSLMLL